MMEMKMYFSKLPDSRDNRGLKHELVNIVVMSIYAVLCGYTDAENMAFFMKLQEEYFTKLLDLKHGVPSADTLLRVFAIIEPESFMQMFYCWIRDVLSVLQKNSDSEVQRIAIDGKAIRAAAEKGGHIPYIISAYLGNYGLSIGQLKVGEKKHRDEILYTIYYILYTGSKYKCRRDVTYVRGHWEIENNLHWVLDVHFREDACKVKVKKAMQNLSLIRKICYNLIKLDKRFDKKKRMTYKKMSMLYNCHLEYIEDLIFERIEL